MSIKAELHCHNSFSNFHLGADEPPYDCGVSVCEQLDRAHALGLDAIFVTNHNTLDGYEQMLKYKGAHEKFSRLGVYPAEEITTDRGAHVIAYGIHDAVPAGLCLGEILDVIRSQGGVSSAPHPFSLLDALRDDAARCDVIETFNSNNVDKVSNVRARQFAVENGNMIQVAGSDSHVISTLGRCTNLIHSENTLDDILSALRQRGRIEIHQTGYALQGEILEHLRYKLDNSRGYVSEYIAQNYPSAKWPLRLLLYAYDLDQNSPLWSIIYKICVHAMRRISKKVNYGGLDPDFMKDRNLFTMFCKSL